MKEEIKPFLSSLVDKNHHILFLGIAILIGLTMNGVVIGNLPITLPDFSVKVLFWLGSGLTSLGLVQLVKNNSPSQKTVALTPQAPVNTDQSELITNLKHAIHEIKEVAKRDGGLTGTQILNIIEDLNLVIVNYEIGESNSILTAQWMKERINRWVSEISINSYSQVNKRNLNQFRDNIRECLNLICINISEGVMYPPSHRNISFCCTSVFSYKSELENIKSKIIQETDNQKYPDLNPGQRQEIIDCIDTMIEDILYEFTSQSTLTS